MNNLIKKIEISYFRSIYSGSMINSAPLNIIVGGNDSGKSNILRVLNLFFNNQTDLNTIYEFERDFSKRRLRETYRGKSKAFLSIKITFNNVFKYTSLPETFQIKKQWNRYSSIPDVTFFPAELRSGSKLQALQRFINKIHVYYIPGVKGKDTFKHFLRLLHDILAQKNAQFSDSTSQLATEVNAAIQSMSESIEEDLGFKSSFVRPKDFRDLFSDLDIETKENNDETVSLQQRGDGIQVSYIPYILDFISKRLSGKCFVWLYEEPENSLELSKAFEQARRFSERFSVSNQIYLTTHSPAFYSLSGPNISKWQVVKRTIQEDQNLFTFSDIEPLNSLEDADQSLGVAALVADRAMDIYNEKVKLEKFISSIEDTLLPIVLCEGITDVMYIRHALEVFNKANLLELCVIMEVNPDGGGSGSGELKKVINDRSKRSFLFHTRCLFIFDNDQRVDNIKVKEGDEIIKFEYYDNDFFKVGIENCLSNTVCFDISQNDSFWTVETRDQGHKMVVTKELKKVATANWVIQRAIPDDFARFEDIVNRIEAFLLGEQ